MASVLQVFLLTICVMTQGADDADVVLEKGVACQRDGELAKAMQHYRQVLILKPKSDVAWFNLAVIYQQKGNGDKAEHCYRKAVELAPENRAYEKALLQLREARATELFDEARKIQETHRGSIRAINLYKKSLTFKPDFGMAWFSLGRVYEDRGDIAEAIEYIKRAAEVEPTNTGYTDYLYKLQKLPPPV